MNIRVSKSLLLLLLLLLLLFTIFIAVRVGIIDTDLLFCFRSRFEYINKDLACGNSFVVKKHAYGKFKAGLEDFIGEKIDEGAISEASVYFRDVKNGPTLGLNEHAEFAPASLLKVPIMMTYLSLSESDPGLLEKQIKFRRLKEGELFKQTILPTESIKEDAPRPIKEFLRYMIQYSDNNAYFTLVQYLNQTYPGGGPFFDTMKGLGIIQPNDANENNLTAKSYGSIFIQLYQSSFFEKIETSEMALAFLAKTDFNDGIVAGVPAGIPVAHKFGERQTEDEHLKQLHDCGIVYYPKNPYLLCVMTRGRDFDKLSGIIGQISKMFYEEFDSRRL